MKTRTRFAPAPNWRQHVACLPCVALTMLAATAAGADYEIRTARQPIVIDLDVIGDSNAEPLPERLAEEVAAEASGDPGRLLALRSNQPWTFSRLSEEEQKALAEAAGDGVDPRAWYESSHASLLLEVVGECRSRGLGPISVFGLPLERTSQGAADAAITNENYAALLAGVDGLVSPRSFILSESATELSTVQYGLPQALSIAAGRPVFYRTNHKWRALVDPSQFDAAFWEGAVLPADQDPDLLAEGSSAARRAAERSGDAGGLPALAKDGIGDGRLKASPIGGGNDESFSGGGGGGRGGGGGGAAGRGGGGSAGGAGASAKPGNPRAASPHGGGGGGAGGGGGNPGEPQGGGEPDPPGGGDDPDVEPRFWTWQTPMADAIGHPYIFELVREPTGREPEAVANLICNKIVERGLEEGEVGINLQIFGQGHGDPEDDEHTHAPALFMHWCDGLTHRPRSDPDFPDLPCEQLSSEDVNHHWYRVPWMSQGIAESREWMEGFIATYKARQAVDPSIPDPSRFHFESEKPVTATHGGTAATFQAMRDDPRWDTEPIAGFDGQTMAELYAAGGSPSYDPTRPFHHLPNREWSKWYMRVCYQAADAAMGEAAYSLIREAWPGCKSSNYRTSVQADGEGTPPRYLMANRNPWLLFTMECAADMQAPPCYQARDPDLPPEEQVPAAVEKAAYKIDINRLSHGGPHNTVSPWVEMVGSERGDKVVDEILHRALLTMMRDKDVREFILWGQDTTQEPEHWNTFVEIIEELFGPPQ